MEAHFKTAVCYFFSLFLVWSAASRADEHRAEYDYQLIWGQSVEMRDGILLNATIYKPELEKHIPTILTITPYISDRYHDDAVWFAKRGYAYVIIDSRGRGNSQGVFEPFLQEAEDGYDAVEWIAKQRWSNGKVGMRGGSYSGHNQWMTAKLHPPHLKSIAPVASPFVGYDFPMRNNRHTVFALQWIMFTSGATSNKNVGYDIDFWEYQLAKLYTNNATYSQLDSFVGMPSKLFTDWMTHPHWDEYWERRNPTDDDLATIDLPILNITGHYDGDQKGALELYRRHMKSAPKSARNRHFLVIGPWEHGGTRTPVKEWGGLTFGDASMLDMKSLDLAWYEWTMEGGSKPEFLRDRIAYFVAGADRWKYARALEEIPDKYQTYFLGARGADANNVFGGGVLKYTKPSIDENFQTYVYDPTKLASAKSPDSWWNSRQLVDQRGIYSLSNSGVIYTSPAFPEKTEISGNVFLDLWLKMDVVDTDLLASLYEVRTDGKTILLTTDSLRARHRDSLSEEKLVEPGTINLYQFKTFDFFSRLIDAGSRLRLVVSGPTSRDYALNLNNAKPVSLQRMSEALPANIHVYHDKKHVSKLMVPIVQRDSKISGMRGH